MATTRKTPDAKRPGGVRAAAKARSREALIDAGIALIAREGIESPSLDAICDRAGYTRGAFYVHFRDRDAFLAAVMDRVGRSFLDGVMPVAADADDLATTMARFVASVADGSYPLGPAGGVRPHQLLAACARSAPIRRRYVALVGEAVGRVERVVRSGQRAGVLRSEPSAGDIAVILLCATIGAHTLLELRAPLSLGRSAAALLGMLAAGPGGGGSRARAARTARAGAAGATGGSPRRAPTGRRGSGA